MNACPAIHCLVYTSKAESSLTERALEATAQKSVERNEKLKCTGVLLFDGRHILQYLEGPKRNLETIFQSIKTNPLHSKIKILHRGAIQKRYFPVWFMGLLRHPESDLLNILNWEWQEAINAMPLNGQANQGVNLVEKFQRHMAQHRGQLLTP